jgi:hypothetical protein
MQRWNETGFMLTSSEWAAANASACEPKAGMGDALADFRLHCSKSASDRERTSSSKLTRCRRSAQRVPSRMPAQGTLMTDREKILIALREKPLKAFEIMKRVNIKHQDDCQSLLLKMRADGVVKFDIHKGHWFAS